MIRAASAVLQLDRADLLAVGVEHVGHHQAAEHVDLGLVALGQHAKLGAQVDDVESVGGDFETAGPLGHDGGDPALVQFRQIGRLDVELGRPFEHDLRAVDERHFDQPGGEVELLPGEQRRAEADVLPLGPFQRQLRVAVILATGIDAVDAARPAAWATCPDATDCVARYVSQLLPLATPTSAAAIANQAVRADRGARSEQRANSRFPFFDPRRQALAADARHAACTARRAGTCSCCRTAGPSASLSSSRIQQRAVGFGQRAVAEFADQAMEFVVRKSSASRESLHGERPLDALVQRAANANQRLVDRVHRSTQLLGGRLERLPAVAVALLDQMPIGVAELLQAAAQRVAPRLEQIDALDRVAAPANRRPCRSAAARRGAAGGDNAGLDGVRSR